jgi:hypothetical protein
LCLGYQKSRLIVWWLRRRIRSFSNVKKIFNTFYKSCPKINSCARRRSYTNSWRKGKTPRSAWILILRMCKQVTTRDGLLTKVSWHWMWWHLRTLNLHRASLNKCLAQALI